MGFAESNPFVNEDWFKVGLLPMRSNSSEWYEQRRSLIGASEIGTVLGVNPFETRYGLWLRKTNQAPDVVSTFRMEAGHYMEDGIAGMAHFHMGNLLTMYEDAGIRVHHNMPYLSCTLDRWGNASHDTDTSVRYILDCKNAGVNTYKKIKPANTPPLYYWLQIQQQLMVTNRSIGPHHGYLAFWAGGQMLKIYYIEHSVLAQNIIAEAAQEFHSAITTNTAPMERYAQALLKNDVQILEEEAKLTSFVILERE